MAKKQKQKTRKSAVKRFKITSAGKVLHRSQGFRHLRSKKSKRWLRRVKKLKEVLGTFKKKLLKMIVQK
ncbi:MAG: 50S ribosomal protein L35 [Patescibacteria group bacterium]|nr:50S ribosomal protein L35 [Patescibacteria group bacterium]